MARKSQGKYKRCQECGAVNQANAFKRAPKTPMAGPDRTVVCPSCGYTAPAWAFVPVEKPAEQREGEG